MLRNVCLKIETADRTAAAVAAQSSLSSMHAWQHQHYEDGVVNYGHHQAWHISTVTFVS